MCYNKYNEREVIIMTDTKWIWVKTEQAFGNGFDEYISADVATVNKYGLMVMKKFLK